MDNSGEMIDKWAEDREGRNQRRREMQMKRQKARDEATKGGPTGWETMSKEERKEWNRKNTQLTRDRFLNDVKEKIRRYNEDVSDKLPLLENETYEGLLGSLDAVEVSYTREARERHHGDDKLANIKSHFNTEYWKSLEQTDENRGKLLNHLLDSMLLMDLNKHSVITKEEYYKLKKSMGITWGGDEDDQLLMELDMMEIGGSGGGGKKSKRKKSKRKSKRKKSKRKSKHKKSKRKSKRKKSRKRR